MSRKFSKHYTRDEVRALLPKVREWLNQLVALQSEYDKNEKRIAGLQSSGQDVGGSSVNKSVQLLVDMRNLFLEFQQREIFIKDLERGLVDFPAIIGGKEVFFCWEKDEADIEFWHDIDSGYTGREPL